MRKVLFDTNVYLRCLHASEYQRAKEEKFAAYQPVTFFCAVVAQELLAGCGDDFAARRVFEIYRPYLRMRRTITPLFADWQESGRVLAWILQDRPDLKSKLPALKNDTLLALCAARLGARLVSANEGDFRLIQKYKRFQLEIF